MYSTARTASRVFLPLYLGSPRDLADEAVANEVEMVDMRTVDDADVPNDNAEETEGAWDYIKYVHLLYSTLLKGEE